jgi:hypothetical protein
MDALLMKNKTIVIENELIFLALQRSGHHAIAYWMLEGLGDKVKFLNNHSCATLDSNMDYIAWNSEDFTLSEYSETKIDEIRKKRLSTNVKINNSQIVLVVRDPYNWAASLIQKYITDSNPFDRVRIWLYKEYLHEAAGISNYIPNAKIILFNKWFTDIEYRNQIIQDFNLNINPSQKYDKVAHNGDGSSFDGTTMDGQASNMKVLERYKHTETIGWKGEAKKRYDKLFDREIGELSKKLFNIKL